MTATTIIEMCRLLADFRQNTTTIRGRLVDSIDICIDASGKGILDAKLRPVGVGTSESVLRAIRFDENEIMANFSSPEELIQILNGDLLAQWKWLDEQ